jgi:hypothetical protein
VIVPNWVIEKRLSGVLEQGMDKTITRFTSFEDAKAEEYRYWQSRPVHERLNAAAELSFMQYQWKEPTRDVQQRLQRTLVRVQRASIL